MTNPTLNTTQINPTLRESKWTVHWRMTESAGLMIFMVDYDGQRFLWEGSLPYVTIDHQRQDLSVEGSSFEHGPFWMPLGTRTLVESPRHNRFLCGFEIAADFATGPFRYTQMWRFHEDGRLEPLLVIHGNGVHDGHTYHPHWRFDFDVNGTTDDRVEHFDGKTWRPVTEEGCFPHVNEGSDDGSLWRQVDMRTGARVAIRPHRGEDAELFAVRYHDSEWPPYTPRGAAGSQPFPAAYVGAEPLQGQDVTLWYVAHVHFNSAFPFAAGPWIRAQKK